MGTTAKEIEHMGRVARDACEAIASADRHRAKIYASGLIAGAVDYLRAARGTIETFEMLQQIADEVIRPELPRGK